MNTTIRRTLGSLIAAAALIGLLARADVKPNALFSEGAVLQQGVALPVWGAARDGEKVTVRLQGQAVSVTAKAGHWRVRLKPLTAGGPFTLSISGDNTLTFTNVLVGEVWLCSGQSNMGFSLSRAENAAEAIARAGDPQLRLFSVPRRAADEPQAELGAGWKESTPASAANFSAVAYFFGRSLRQARHVPVGLIDSSVGGTPAEAWTAHAALQVDPELKAILEAHAATVRSYDGQKADAANRKAAERYQQAKAKARAEGKEPPAAPRQARDPATSLQRPCGLYNAMIVPLQPYAIAGAIWYQGEANSGRAAQYQRLFPALIRSWRDAWGQGDFPFLFVQIAPHERMSPEIREAQLLTWQRVPRTAMAVTADVGAATDIHPKQKEPVGARLALAARAVAYGEKLEYSGPIYASMKVEGPRALLSFSHVGSGLVARGGQLKGFTIGGPDGKFVEAAARIEGDKVIVEADGVRAPVAVRYGWTQVPEVNLFNREGLPASPFRTDAP